MTNNVRHLYLSEKPLVWYWGLIQVYSIFFSFSSLLQTCVQFNEWPKRRHTMHKMLLAVPYFVATIAYRAIAIVILVAFAGQGRDLEKRRLAFLPSADYKEVVAKALKPLFAHFMIFVFDFFGGG
jgi:hypothetical protein